MKPSHALAEMKNTYLHNLKSQPRRMQSAIIVQRKEALLSSLQAYIKHHTSLPEAFSKHMHRRSAL
jgi:hypothetical protein